MVNPKCPILFPDFSEKYYAVILSESEAFLDIKNNRNSVIYRIRQSIMKCWFFKPSFIWATHQSCNGRNNWWLRSKIPFCDYFLLLVLRRSPHEEISDYQIWGDLLKRRSPVFPDCLAIFFIHISLTWD